MVDEKCVGWSANILMNTRNKAQSLGTLLAMKNSIVSKELRICFESEKRVPLSRRALK